MKLRLEFHGILFEYEKKPMQEGRFRRLCAIATAAMYVSLVIGVTRLCGLLGLLVVVSVTGIAFVIDSI